MSGAGLMAAAVLYHAATYGGLYVVVQSQKHHLQMHGAGRTFVGSIGTPTWICAVFTLSLALRGVWLPLRTIPWTVGNVFDFMMYNVNRVSLLLQLTGVSLVARLWMHVVSGGSRRAVDVGILLFNLVAYVIVLSLQTYGPLYRINLIIIACTSLAVPALTLAVGCRLPRVFQSIAANDTYRATALAKLRCAMVVCVVAFALRASLFLASPVFKVDRFSPEWLDALVYPWGFYVLPDLLPNLTFMHSSNARAASAAASATPRGSRNPAAPSPSGRALKAAATAPRPRPSLGSSSVLNPLGTLSHGHPHVSPPGSPYQRFTRSPMQLDMESRASSFSYVRLWAARCCVCGTAKAIASSTAEIGRGDCREESGDSGSNGDDGGFRSAFGV